MSTFYQKQVKTFETNLNEMGNLNLKRNKKFFLKNIIKKKRLVQDSVFGDQCVGFQWMFLLQKMIKKSESNGLEGLGFQYELDVQVKIICCSQFTRGKILRTINKRTKKLTQSAKTSISRFNRQSFIIFITLISIHCRLNIEKYLKFLN